MNMKTPLVPFQAGSPIMVAGPTASVQQKDILDK